ncbi:MaoC/PaaZ C-terminal domain-containing protein [Streptomyces sp. NPDC060020]|uniref:MaoC/PaaZ C-terminal domain-containing protein n=1 Tax=Streptomyces sp. NPDC060020 TaxID=3347038 RepID=UPI0036926DE2
MTLLTLPSPVRTLTVTEPEITDYRGAARRGLPTARPGQASPVHTFVLAHTVAEQTVAALTAAEPGPVSVVHLGQDIRTVRPVRPGETVNVALEVAGIRKEPRGARIALRVRLVGEDGPEPFAELTISALLVGATRLEPFGDIGVGPAAPAPAGAGEPQTAVHALTTDWITTYAHASGDLNPIHLDADAARGAGFDTVIAHGMSVVALAVEEAVDRFADGDAARVRGLGCRFSAPVPPGIPLEILLQPDAEARLVRFTCKTPKGAAVKSGWIELAQPAPREGEDRP